MKPFKKTKNKFKQFCYSIESHTLQLVCEVSAKSKEYIADMLCDRNFNIYASMCIFFLLFVCKLFLNHVSCLKKFLLILFFA